MFLIQHVDNQLRFLLNDPDYFIMDEEGVADLDNIVWNDLQRVEQGIAELWEPLSLFYLLCADQIKVRNAKAVISNINDLAAHTTIPSVLVLPMLEFPPHHFPLDAFQISFNCVWELWKLNLIDAKNLMCGYQDFKPQIREYFRVIRKKLKIQETEDFKIFQGISVDCKTYKHDYISVQFTDMSKTGTIYMEENDFEHFSTELIQ